VARRREPVRISVLAGVNGAGKSSIGGAAIRAFGGEYFDPDEAAQRLRAANPSLEQVDANGLAWQQGRRLLERAIAEGQDFVLETTLGGNTMTRMLGEAARRDIEVHVWYVGLASLALHLARIRARVRRGGHDIPEADVRRRHHHSRLNLVHLLPRLASLKLYDNSADADPAAGLRPLPVLVLDLERGVIRNPIDLAQAPEWAKPIVMAALKLPRRKIRLARRRT
jgi:predicted ABC-type ATPase